MTTALPFLTLFFLSSFFLFCHPGYAAELPYPPPIFRGEIGKNASESVADWPHPPAPSEEAPNVVLVLLDDVGYAATDLFGGPVQMPALNALARQGIRYNRFHVSALCAPTRAALLSGRNPHQLGFGAVPDGPKGFPGYNAVWPNTAASLAEILRLNGYSTAAFGKWHNTPYWEINPVGPFERWPTGLGFEYFYGFMKGLDDHWAPSSLYRNTTAIEPKGPEEGYNLTTDIADEAINWLHTHEALAPQKPYFIYFATGATHIPLQAPKAWIEKYRGKFDQGWEKLREDIFRRQKAIGIVPANTKLTAEPKWAQKWDSLNTEQRAVLAREMELFAGFLAHTGYEIGRLLEAVQKGPRSRNTLIIYVAGDNGAEGIPSVYRQNLSELLPEIDRLGGVDSPEEVMVSAEWSWAMNTPFQGMKGDAAHLGGTRAPVVISWPGHTEAHEKIRGQFIHVIDIAPTIYEVVGIQFPEKVNGIKQIPLAGASFAETFRRPDASPGRRKQVFVQSGSRAVYQDGWIAGLRPLDWLSPKEANPNPAQWELYNLEDDFSQAINLAARYPEKLDKLKALFEKEALKQNLYPLISPSMPNSDPRLGARFRSSMITVPGSEMPGSAQAAAEGGDYVYRPGLPRVPGWAMPSFTHSSHAFTADLSISGPDTEGVIFSLGSRQAGFVLYAKDSLLIYENKPAASEGTAKQRMVSSTVLPQGKVSVRLDFDMKERIDYLNGAKGMVHMYMNGKLVGEMPVQIAPDTYMGSFGVGRAFGTSVSTEFTPPFKFSGTLEQVRLQIRANG